MYIEDVKSKLALIIPQASTNQIEELAYIVLKVAGQKNIYYRNFNTTNCPLSVAGAVLVSDLIKEKEREVK